MNQVDGKNCFYVLETAMGKKKILRVFLGEAGNFSVPIEKILDLKRNPVTLEKDEKGKIWIGGIEVIKMVKE